MSNTNTPAASETLTAIARSISHTEIATICVHTRDDYDAVCAELDAVEADSVEVEPGHTDAWGTDDDGAEWRVRVILV